MHVEYTCMNIKSTNDNIHLAFVTLVNKIYSNLRAKNDNHHLNSNNYMHFHFVTSQLFLTLC